MHRHLDPETTQSGDLPGRLYVQLDDIAEGEYGRVDYRLSAVRADEFDAVQGSAWESYWSTLLLGNQTGVNLFDRLSIWCLEVSAWPGNDPLRASFDEWSAEATEQPVWAEVYVGLKRSSSGPSGDASLAYEGLFATPVPFEVKQAASLPSYKKTQLNAAFGMATLPSAALSDVGSALAGTDADWLTAYDVGQGNACALSKDGCVSLWTDIGKGVYGNARTCAAGLVLCHRGTAPVLLTHWDTDHWAGGPGAAPAGKAHVFLSRVWLVPRQHLGPTHAALAHDILRYGGRILVVDPVTLPSGTASFAIKNHRTLEIGLGTSTRVNDRNNCRSLLVRVHDDGGQSISATQKRWLLPGDASFGRHPPGWAKDEYVAIAAPHHGANIGRTPPPLPSGQPYKRVVFSFGANNSHGRTRVRHPEYGTVTSWDAQSWQVPGWIPPAACGTVICGGDALSTAINGGPAGLHLGGIAVGWTSNAGAPSGTPCGAACTASLDQS